MFGRAQALNILYFLLQKRLFGLPTELKVFDVGKNLHVFAVLFILKFEAESEGASFVRK
jgi:hypothetical protein